MKRFLLIAGLAAAMLFTTGRSASAQSTADVYVVHGINGEDLGATAELPVDVNISGVGCALQEFKFGEVVGPVPLPAGTYDVTISLANIDTPCSNDAVISASITLEAGKTYTVIAHLSAASAPTASLFENDLSATEPGKARVIVHHTAAAPAVDITVQRDAEDPKSPKLTIENFANGDQAAAEVRPGEWDVSIAPAGTSTPVFGPAAVELKPFTGYLIYAVGTPGSTFTLITKPIKGLK